MSQGPVNTTEVGSRCESSSRPLMQEDLLLGKTKPAAERCEWDTRWGEGTVKQLGSEKDLKMLCEELISYVLNEKGI